MRQTYIARWMAVSSIAIGVAHAQPGTCAAWDALERDIVSAGESAPLDAVAARAFLDRALVVLADPACANDRAAIRLSTSVLARAASDWPTLRAMSSESIADLPQAPADTATAETRVFWLGEAAHAETRMASDPPGVARATSAIDAFVAAAFTAISPSAGNTEKWIVPIADAIAGKARLLRGADNVLGAAAAEQQGALTVLGFGLDSEAHLKLGGFAPDEFLQRAAADYLALNRMDDCLGVLSSICAMPNRTRSASIHARVLVSQADKDGRLGEYVHAVWARLPRDGALVLLVNGSAVRAKKADEAQIAAILDQVLELPDEVFAEATRLRDERRPESRNAADAPVRAHVTVHRAMLAASLGDFQTTDRMLEDIERRGWNGSWCDSQKVRIDFERRRER